LRMLDVPKDLPDSLSTAPVQVGEDDDDLSIAGLGSGSGVASLIAHDADAVRSRSLNAHDADAVRSRSLNAHDADAVRSRSLNAHDADAVRSRSVSSVTQPPVQADSPAPAEESEQSGLDRRPFLTSALVGPKVPNFRGMTLRAVLEESAARGVQIEVLGNGLVRKQEPPAGSILAPGSRVRVQFTR
ncbi:MAG: PASTA domain-containing protein, partial [Bryobacteraceae bacterium]